MDIQSVYVSYIHRKAPRVKWRFAIDEVTASAGNHAQGVALAAKALGIQARIVMPSSTPELKVVGVRSRGAEVVLPSVDGFADGTAVAQVGAYGFEICRDWVDEVITVSNDQLCSAIKLIYDDTRSITEPSGALAVAGICKHVTERGVHGQMLVAINSGANINFDSLRYVAERVVAQSTGLREVAG